MEILKYFSFLKNLNWKVIEMAWISYRIWTEMDENRFEKMKEWNGANILIILIIKISNVPKMDESVCSQQVHSEPYFEWIIIGPSLIRPKPTHQESDFGFD